MVHKKSILAKILLFIGVPVIIAFCLTAVFILQIVGISVSDLTQKELTSKSASASYQVSEFFTKHLSIAEQMSTNSQIEKVFEETVPGKIITSVDSFANAKKTMINVQETDPKNIVVSWIADADTNQLTQSDGYLLSEGWNMKERPWYASVMENQSVVLTNPYQDTATGNIIVSAICPVYKENSKEFLGVVGIDFSIENIGLLMKEYKLGETGFYILTTSNGQVIYHPNEEYINKSISETDLSDNIINAIENNESGQIEYQFQSEKAHGYVSNVGDTGWVVATGLPDKEFNRTFNSVRNAILISFGIAIVIIIALILIIAIGIVKPLKKLRGIANEIADGNLNVQMDIQSRDEIGQVADAFEKTVVRLSKYIDYITEISEALNTFAKGDMCITLNQDYADEFSPIKKALNDISVSLSQSLSAINLSAEQVNAGASQVADSAQVLSSGATHQASSIEQLSASINEIYESANKNAENVYTAFKYVDETVLEVEESNNYMKKMLLAMNEIEITSNEISKITKAIEAIAFQTNILALNAAIEASRAGNAGKGFAVVADEVRNLAAKSAEAAKNTVNLIEKSISSVQEGSGIARNTAKSLEIVSIKTKNVKDIIVEIDSASQAQTSSISEINLGIEQISAIIQNNAATAEESSASSEELSAQAAMLKDETRKFKLLCD